MHGREPHTAGGAPLTSSRVLHPLDSRHIRTSVSGDTVEDRSGGPASVVEATRCPYGAPAGETCVTAHAAATLDVFVEQCRAACDRTEHCVAFTHHVASAEAAELGYPSQCTLLGGVSGQGAVARASAGGAGDDDPEAKRVGLPGHQTYFLAPPGTRYAELGIQRCVQPVKGRNVAPPIPASPDGSPACEALRKPPHGQKSYEVNVIWSATLNDGLGAVTLDEIVLTDPDKAAGARVLAGFPLAYVQCGVVDADAGETQTFRACRGVKATEIHVVAPWYRSYLKVCGVEATAAGEPAFETFVPLPEGFELQNSTRPERDASGLSLIHI